ncbi:MAG: DUF3168 domain-containing protein [Hyphomicrobiaceae bacterium]|nr:MAG: DUF3168 domain-containing protein [Hyphomicrobiaceae bacterium]
MLFSLVFNWTYTTATADTGAGGLFGTPALITGWYLDGEPTNPTMPYVVVTPVTETENDVLSPTPETVDITFQFGVYTPDEAGQAAMDAITNRIRTVFRRALPTISGYTTSQILLEGTPFAQITERARYVVIQARAVLSK